MLGIRRTNSGERARSRDGVNAAGAGRAATLAAAVVAFLALTGCGGAPVAPAGATTTTSTPTTSTTSTSTTSTTTSSTVPADPDGGYVLYNGFTSPIRGNLGAYAIRFADTESISSSKLSTARGYALDVTGELNGIVGRAAFGVDIFGVATSFDMERGVINVRFEDTLPGTAVAQALPGLPEIHPDGHQYWTSGWVEVLSSLPDSDLREILAHEIGHTLGLGHFQEQYAGSYQLMHPSSALAPSSFQAGDRNGILFLDSNRPQ